MQNNHEGKYFNIYRFESGKEIEIKKQIPYKEACEWLKENRYSLFGVYIRHLNESWGAAYFLRYETTI